MTRTSNKHLSTWAVFALLSVSLWFPAEVTLASSGGRTGLSGNPATGGGAICSQCHSGGAAPTVNIAGPATATPGATNTYTLTVTGGPAVVGGFDVSGSAGTMTAIEVGTRLQSGEVTQSSPRPMAGGTTSWTFNWQAPATAGLYTLYGSAVSANGDGGFGGDGVAASTLQVNVAAANQLPIANTGGPYTGMAGVTLQFNGGGSTDPDGSIVSYAWDFGDGGTGAGVNPGYAYATAGTYTVSLTVTDNMGATDTATTTATIVPVNQPLPPVANPGGPYSGTAGVAVQFNGSGSSDPDGVVMSYAWSFGDGATATGANPMHTYATAGTYSVSLTVTDNDGLTNTATTTANISSGTQPPVANAGGPYTGSAGVAVQFDGAGSSDPDGSIVSYSWSFGDGGTASGASPSYTYATAGTYAVTLTVTDNDGLVGTDQTTATISAAPPPPPPSTGEQLYNDNCAACHGPGGKGGPEEAVDGASAKEISEAINEERAMSFLQGVLSAADIQAIADYLGGKDEECKGDKDDDKDKDKDKHKDKGKGKGKKSKKSKDKDKEKDKECKKRD